ncbi:hypothetical protein NPIL_274521 [Nephila pilipes]|uniref:Uncharacterized protein n=1 Tax=Nephila pilipes TaxID=299642 RepID=A0A8X6NNA7_NEPPI|nr:hypothetical protein NPIL_274521 [Nephila pilipes]
MVRTKDGGSQADTLLAVRTTSAINRCPGDDLKTYRPHLLKFMHRSKLNTILIMNRDMNCQIWKAGFQKGEGGGRRDGSSVVDDPNRFRVLSTEGENRNGWFRISVSQLQCV